MFTYHDAQGHGLPNHSLGKLAALNYMSRSEYWPPLPLHEWQNTYRTLHMWTQIVGKVRMALSPPLNHWWHVALYVNSRGLTRSEEHTSELQSLRHLVCRLLLEKKKFNRTDWC